MDSDSNNTPGEGTGAVINNTIDGATFTDSTVNMNAGDVYIIQQPGVEKEQQIDINELVLELRTKLKQEAEIAAKEMQLPVELDHPINAVALDITSDLKKETQIVDAEGHYHRREDFLSRFERPEGNVTLERLFPLAREKAVKEAAKKCPLKLVRDRFVQCHGNIVGVVGQAGIGKTTLTKILARRILDEGLFEVKYLFYILFRNINFSAKTNLLEFLLTSSLCGNAWSHKKESNEILLQDIESCENVILILDGLDEAILEHPTLSSHAVSLDSIETAEVFIKNILCGKLLSKAKKFVTSRPRQLYDLHPECRPHFIASVLGLNQPSQEELCREICGEDAGKVLEYLKEHPEISAYCYVPVNCILTMYCIHKSLSESEEISIGSITSVLTYALDGYVRSDHLRGKSFEPMKLADLAWNGFEEHKIIFDEDDLAEVNINENTLRAFLNTYVDSNLRVKILEGDKRSYFSHLIWQEFFSAVKLILCMLVPEFKKLVSNFDDSRWEIVTKFMFGLCNKATFNKLKRILPRSIDVKQKKEMQNNWMEKRQLLKDFAIQCLPSVLKNDTTSDFLRVCGWALETSEPDLAKDVAAKLPLEVNLAEKVLPSDVTSLHYLLRLSNRPHVVRVGFGSAFNSVRFTGDGFRLFFKQMHETRQQSNAKVTKVMIEKSEVTEEGIAELCKSLATIEELTIYKCNVTSSQVKILSEAVNRLEKPIKLVNLGGNPIGDEGAIALASCLPKIRDLSVISCGLSGTAVKEIASALLRLPEPIERIAIDSNKEIKEDAANLLPCLTTVNRSIGMSQCRIPQDVIDQFISELDKLPDPKPTVTGLKAIQQSL